MPNVCIKRSLFKKLEKPPLRKKSPIDQNIYMHVMLYYNVQLKSRKIM